MTFFTVPHLEHSSRRSCWYSKISPTSISNALGSNKFLTMTVRSCLDRSPRSLSGLQSNNLQQNSSYTNNHSENSTMKYEEDNVLLLSFLYLLLVFPPFLLRFEIRVVLSFKLELCWLNF